MNPSLRQAYDAELKAARAARLAEQAGVAFHHLERAHILSQRHTLQHVYVHWLMLRVAAASGACREAAGQVTRIVAAAVFSRIWVPLGNTGRAGVSAVKPMPVPEDLRALLGRGRSGSASWR